VAAFNGLGGRIPAVCVAALTGIRTVVHLLDTPYEKGVKVCGKEKAKLEQRLQRSLTLHWWDDNLKSGCL